MKILIDSHFLIWLIFEPGRVAPEVRSLLESSDGLLVSLVGVWELGIKHGVGKLAYSPEQLLGGIGPLGADLLSLEPRHILEYGQLTINHKDPFDKLLLSQAKSENAQFLTADRTLLSLGLDFIVDAAA